MPFSRKKSCSACRAAKARCNLATPSCCRCLRRTLHCEYEGRDTGRTPYSQGSPADRVSVSSSGEAVRQPEFSLATTSNFHDYGFLLTNPQAEKRDSGYKKATSPEWGLIDGSATTGLASSPSSLELSLPGSSQHPIILESNIQQYDISSPSILPSALPDAILMDPATWFNNIYVSPAAITHWSSSLKQALRLRHAAKACLVTTVVLGQLKGYPRMMIHGRNLPPFMYPRCPLDEELSAECMEKGKHHCLPKPLAICASLLQMFYSRTAGSTEFVWRTIYAEQARLYHERHGYSAQELLEALQAITIYILLQAYDLDSVDLNDAGSLVMTALAMVKIFVDSYDWRSNISPRRVDRRDWILLESARRTIALLYVIGLLLEGLMGPASRGICEDRQSVPLPCTRELWEARSNAEWKKRYEKVLRGRKSAKVLTLADLLTLQTPSTTSMENVANDPEVLADLRNWCEDLDGFGILIWTSVPFERYRLSGAWEI